MQYIILVEPTEIFPTSTNYLYANPHSNNIIAIIFIASEVRIRIFVNSLE